MVYGGHLRPEAQLLRSREAKLSEPNDLLRTIDQREGISTPL